MKILFIYKTYYPESFGGVEEVLRVLMHGLAKRGHECTLLVASQRDTAYVRQEEGVIIQYCPTTMALSSCPLSITFVQKFYQLSREHDIVHFHFPWPYADLVQFCVRTSKPYFVTYHSDIVRQKVLNIFYSPLCHWFLSHAKAIIATSEQYKQSSPVLARYQNRVRVIPIGLPEGLPAETFTKEREFWLSKLGRDFFLFVGVLRYYKGLSYLLDAAEGSTYPIVIAGNGPEKKALHQLAAQKNLQHVYFLDEISQKDKAALLDLCKAVIIPASERSEAYCLSLVEGLRAGKPLISTELGTGTSFVNEHGVTGIVVLPKNSQKLRAAMQEMWDNPQECTQYGLSARQRFVTHFTANTMIELYDNLFVSTGPK